MPKSITESAVVFSLKPQGENNSSVLFFTKESGIVYATMYGGAKSRLRSLVSPWNSGLAYFSKDAKTGFLKISDFDVKKYHLTFRENLLKNYASSLAAEITIKTKCAGNSEKLWPLLNGFIDGLDLCKTDEQSRSGLIRFLWRFLLVLGIQPDANSCAYCGKEFLSGKNEVNALSYNQGGANFLINENQFVCSECWNKNEKSIFHLNHDAIHYLSAIGNLSLKETRNLHLEETSIFELKNLLFYLIENAVGTKLASIETGKGIL